MSLPTQKYAVYPITIPSTKQKTTFKGFTVKEEKLMLVAKESDDDNVIINTTMEVINNCLGDGIVAKDLTLFDVEYILTQIRAKAVGEIVELEFECPENAEHPKALVMIDLTKIEVKVDPEHSLNISLFDDVGVVMRYPKISEYSMLNDLDGIELTVALIDHIYTKDEILHATDHTKEELIDWIMSLSKNQLEQIEDKFFNRIPVYQYTIEYQCKECEAKESITVKGLKSFFV